MSWKTFSCFVPFTDNLFCILKLLKHDTFHSSWTRCTRSGPESFVVLIDDTLYQDELTTDKKPTVVYSIRDDISDGYSILR